MLRKLALAAAIVVPGYVAITRAHDHYTTRAQFVCIERGAPYAKDDDYSAALKACGAYEKKLVYSDRVWGRNKLVDPRMRDDFGDLLESLAALLPWLLLSARRELTRAAYEPS